MKELVAACLLTFSMAALAVDVTLTDDGTAGCAIYVLPEIMAANQTIPRTQPQTELTAETQRQKLREAVRDLATYLGRISGATIPIHERAPTEADGGVPLLIGALAVERFGAVGQESFFTQGWRLVITPEGLGFMGESDESTTYAIYELLDRLGCRWYIPGEIGEVIPSQPTIRVAASDVSQVPHTPNRAIWYASPDYMRRNRLGGFTVSAGHALDGYIPKDTLAANPKLNAMQNGVRNIDSGFLCWGNPETAQEVGASILRRLDNRYIPSVSLSPKDGVAFCECEEFCKPLDAGDWDPSMDTESITDRYIVFCNRIVELVTAKYPDVQFGFLAYVQYTRPPLREIPHPNLVPEIAPITYCRAHAMTNDDCVSRSRLKPIVEGWNRVSKRFAYYNYMFHLAETSVPYPMIRQMSEELPIIYGGEAEVFWQPETMPNFESVLPGMWLTMRMAWDKTLEPAAVLQEFYHGFYGNAAAPMQRYWEIFDNAWNDVPEHAGSGWSYVRRFTPEVMTEARAAMNEALAAAETPMEYRRIALFDASLRQFERWMQMRWDLNSGRSQMLKVQALAWMGTQIGLGHEYDENYAFTKVGWSAVTNIGGTYFQAFHKATYDDIGERTGRSGKFLNVLPTPAREWRYSFLVDEGNRASRDDTIKGGVELGEEQNWQAADFDASEWATTDLGVDTWATLGLLGRYGTMWYRTSISIPGNLPAGKRLYLWLAATDGSVKLYIDGQHIPYVKDDGTAADVASGYAKPFTYDVTDHMSAGKTAQVTIAGTRLFINELGTGGLLGPIYILRDR